MPHLRPNPIAATLAAVLLAACVGGSPSTRLVDTHIETSTRSNFTFCSNFGCSVRWTMGLSEADWQTIRAYFEPAVPDAAAERQQIADAIGALERIVGKATGTDKDRPGTDQPIIDFRSTEGQLDCIDEAHNTTLYLTFMERDGLLKWHTVGEALHRGMVIDRWFHNTATVVEKDTGLIYAIDSWFGSNGEPADVVTARSWLDGWEPDQPGQAAGQ